MDPAGLRQVIVNGCDRVEWVRVILVQSKGLWQWLDLISKNNPGGIAFRRYILTSVGCPHNGTVIAVAAQV